MAASAVDAVEVGKSYGGVAALTSASFTATAGEVHALVGENGAGKSTLIKILGGRVRPDTGTVRIRGQAVSLSGPQAAHDLGAWTVFQELTLLPWMTVAENLLLLREPKGAAGLISRSATIRDADALLAQFGVMHIDPRALVEDISLAERQTVEIVRAVSNDPQILFLDEPTSSLVEREVEWLFGQIRALRSRGACVVFTSHRWAEIRSIADRITIFRGGTDVGTFTEIHEDEAVRLMTDAGVWRRSIRRSRRSRTHRKSRLRRRRSPGRMSVTFPSVSARARSSVWAASPAMAIANCSAPCLAMPMRVAVSLWFTDGRARSAHHAPLLPRAWRSCRRDRKTEGLLLRMSVRDNATLAILKRLTRFGVLKPAEERRAAQSVVDSLRVRTAGINQPVGALSGGNQQKVLLGRWLLAECQILLLYDVTRGVDVATKHEIYELVLKLATEGHAIVFYSSDAEELAHLCHRVLVMREGVVAAELQAPGITAEDIVSAAVRDHLAA